MERQKVTNGEVLVKSSGDRQIGLDYPFLVLPFACGYEATQGPFGIPLIQPPTN
jgi:hypothetical protein